MRKLTVTLSAEFADFVESEVASGEYASTSEVVRDRLRLLQREKAACHEKILIFRREVGIGMAQAGSGRLSTQSVAEIVAGLDAEE